MTFSLSSHVFLGYDNRYRRVDAKEGKVGREKETMRRPTSLCALCCSLSLSLSLSLLLLWWLLVSVVASVRHAPLTVRRPRRTVRRTVT